MTDDAPSNGGFDPDDPILAAWADQGDVGAPPQLTSNPEALVESVARAHRKDQRRLLWLNVREVIPSLFIAGLFAANAPGSERPAAVLAAAFLVLAVGCFLAVSSIRHHRAERRWGTSVRDQLARRLAQLNYGARLLRTVGWWYFLPLAVAIALFYYGTGGGVPTGQDLVIFGFCAALFVVMYRINRRVGRTRYEEEAERLESLLADFDRAV